ncbi:MAG: DUF58 domain-containing protein [Chthonomonadales bacterium]
MVTHAPPETKQRLADPQTLARIARLELRARVVVEGIISGMHRSPHHGYSVEFAQHRQYTRGDEIRHIDWKVYGRTDRYYVKQFEEETNLKAYLVVDASSSMMYRSGALSKLDYAAVVAAALASLLVQQRDAVGLALFTDAVQAYIPPGSTPSHMRLLLEHLEQPPIAPKTGVSHAFHDLAERIRRRGLIIVLSDLFDDPKAVLNGLQHFRHRKHEVIVFHVLDRDELTFPFRDAAVFEGMEGEGLLPAEPHALRKEYLRLFDDYVAALRRGCREMAIDYVSMPTDQRVDDALAHYLHQRTRTR